MRRAVFLDKDGVINVDRGHVVRPRGTDFIGGIFDVCRTANRLGWLVAVVTNQSAIGRGHCSEAEFLGYMDWVRGEFTDHGAQLDAVYYCPHHPVEGHDTYKTRCGCRKPQPGMLLAAQREWGLDMHGSLLLGDHESDIKAGMAAGVGTNLMVSTVVEGKAGRTVYAEDFLRCVDRILNSGSPASSDGG